MLCCPKLSWSHYNVYWLISMRAARLSAYLRKKLLENLTGPAISYIKSSAKHISNSTNMRWKKALSFRTKRISGYLPLKFTFMCLMLGQLEYKALANAVDETVVQMQEWNQWKVSVWGITGLGRLQIELKTCMDLKGQLRVRCWRKAATKRYVSSKTAPMVVTQCKAQNLFENLHFLYRFVWSNKTLQWWWWEGVGGE